MAAARLLARFVPNAIALPYPHHFKRPHPQTQLRTLAACLARVLPKSVLPSEIRGHRECRAISSPAASYAKVESIRVSHYRSAKRSGIPCAMVLRFPSCSPRRPGFVVSVFDIDAEASMSEISASGHQAHTTSPSEIMRVVDHAKLGHRIRIQRFVTIAIRPSCGRGRAGLVEMICPSGKVQNFCRRDWTRQTNHAGRRVRVATDLSA
jgi:hypothetical protein